MLRPATAASGIGHLGSWFARLVITLIVLAAFTVQANIAQSHIHGAQPLRLDGLVLHNDGSQLPQNVPAKRDPGDCPACRLFVQAGNYVAPSVVALLQPLFVRAAGAILVDSTLSSQASSHDWHSRGPPLSR